MSQKAMALEVGVDQAILCAAEKGRRGSLSDGAMEMFSRSLGLSEELRVSLIWKGEHDRLLREIARGPLIGSMEMVSAAFVAHKELAPRARAGLVEVLRRMAKSGQDIQELEDLARGAEESLPVATGDS